MKELDPLECPTFMYHVPYGLSSSPFTPYQPTHQHNGTKQTLTTSPVTPHWGQFPASCQCVTPAPHCPHPTFSIYSYANQWPAQPHPASFPTFQAAHMHPGTIYQREPGYTVPLHLPESLPSYPSMPPTTTDHVAYTPSNKHGPKSRQKDAQFSQHQFGPPQKPLQSRYALWVGGIPSDTHVLTLRDHFFVPETATDILSVVLMPRSHSGFVNFRTARSCKAAAYRFNNSAMNNTFLRCRCRRPGPDADPSASTCESTSSSSSPNSDLTPPSATESNFSIHLSDEETTNSSLRSDSPNHVTNTTFQVEEHDDVSHHPIITEMHASVRQNDSLPADHQKLCRYFLIKSLTDEELVASVTSGRWATQSQNEAMLNEAYRTRDAVYLIFSVNRSGEFFGYARMASSIKADANATPAKKPSSSTDTATETFAASSTYKTPAKGLIPEGRVVDELYRGKIFWEICETENSAPIYSPNTSSDKSISSFKIDWISTRKLPFWQTKHLQNPWNNNKPVKVGRDGTELETDVGRRLCHLFLSPSGRKLPNHILP